MAKHVYLEDKMIGSIPIVVTHNYITTFRDLFNGRDFR